MPRGARPCSAVSPSGSRLLGRARPARPSPRRVQLDAVEMMLFERTVTFWTIPSITLTVRTTRYPPNPRWRTPRGLSTSLINSIIYNRFRPKKILLQRFRGRWNSVRVKKLFYSPSFTPPPFSSFLFPRLACCAPARVVLWFQQLPRWLRALLNALRWHRTLFSYEVSKH